jgi:hypothetical protein
MGHSPQETGEAEDRRKPGCSVGEGFPPFIVLQDTFVLLVNDYSSFGEIGLINMLETL